MPMQFHAGPSLAMPNEEERRMAREASRRLSDSLSREGRLEIRAVGESDQPVEVPASAMRLFSRLLAEMADGHAVAILSEDEEVSSSNAAHLLGIAHPALLAVLERGEIAFRDVAGDLSIRLGDLTDYQRREQAERLKAMEALAKQAQELGMGY